MVISFSLFHLSHPRSKPILPVFVVDHNVFKFFLHEFFLAPVIEDAQLDFFEVYFLLECFKLLYFKFPKNSQEGLCCHVQELTVCNSSDSQLPDHFFGFFFIFVKLVSCNIH